MKRQKKKTPDLLSEVLAGSETEEGFREKIKGCSNAKTRTLLVHDYIVNHEPSLFKDAEVLRACSNWLVFRHFYTVQKYRLIGGCTCKKHLVCAMCAWRRSAKSVMLNSSKIAQVMQSEPDLIPILITLTIKNGPDLDERFTHLDGAISRMIRNRSLSKNGNRHKTVFRLVHGAAGAFEFKRGKGSGLWHPHMHMIALVDQKADLLEMEWNMSEEWRKLTKDSFNVDVRPIDMSSEKSRMGAICEVFRYALKFGEMEIVDQVHAYKVLKTRRLVRSFGSLYGVPEPTDTNDTIEDNLKLLPYIDLVFEYSNQKGYFLTDVTDTEDRLTGGSMRLKSTEGSKTARRISSEIFITVKDPNETERKKINRKRSIDLNYMKQWVASADIEETYKPTEVPF